MNATSLFQSALNSLQCIALAGAALCVSPPAHAQDWPSKPIRMVISFPPGSSPDVVGRALAPGLSQALRQPVITENRSGVSGILGSDVVAKSPPDGYTVLMTSGSSMSISIHTLDKLPFNPATDLVPVAATARIELFLVARADAPFKTFAEFLAYARAHPGKLSYGTPGIGSAPHIATELLKSQTKIFAVHVPYRGSAPALQDLLGGVVDFVFDPGVALAHVKSGRLQLLAVGGATRSVLFPDTPTLQELGLPRFDSGTTHALWAPAGTPQAIVDRLNHEVNLLLATPAVAQQIRGLGAEPTPMSPADLRAVIARDSRRYAEIVKERGIKEP